MYDINSVLGYESYYRDGYLEWQKDYDKDGKMECKREYQKGAPGNEIETIQCYYKNGNLWLEMNYKGRMPKLRDGLWSIYDEQGNTLEEIMYKEDKPIYGYLYNGTGKKREMTKAHLYNRTKSDDKAYNQAVEQYMKRFPTEY